MFALWYLSFAVDELRKHYGWTFFDIFYKTNKTDNKTLDTKPANLTATKKLEATQPTISEPTPKITPPTAVTKAVSPADTPLPRSDPAPVKKPEWASTPEPALITNSVTTKITLPTAVTKAVSPADTPLQRSDPAPVKKPESVSTPEPKPITNTVTIINTLPNAVTQAVSPADKPLPRSDPAPVKKPESVSTPNPAAVIEPPKPFAAPLAPSHELATATKAPIPANPQKFEINVNSSMDRKLMEGSKAKENGDNLKNNLKNATMDFLSGETNGHAPVKR